MEIVNTDKAKQLNKANCYGDKKMDFDFKLKRNKQLEDLLKQNGIEINPDDEGDYLIQIGDDTHIVNAGAVSDYIWDYLRHGKNNS